MALGHLISVAFLRRSSHKEQRTKE